jgi:hypothetical protein
LPHLRKFRKYKNILNLRLNLRFAELICRPATSAPSFDSFLSYAKGSFGLHCMQNWVMQLKKYCCENLILNMKNRVRIQLLLTIRDLYAHHGMSNHTIFQPIKYGATFFTFTKRATMA